MNEVPEVVDPVTPPDNLNPVQKALYQKLMSTTGLLLQAGFAVNDIMHMIRMAAELQRKKDTT